MLDPLYCTRMQLQNYQLCDKAVYDLRIIVIVYNRHQSLLRLLDSLNAADYSGDNVKLEVWIDRSVRGTLDELTVKTAKSFIFLYGEYQVISRVQHAGIFGQWISTWRPEKENYEIAVVLEDDLTVSKFFYRYLKLVHKKYDAYPFINGYTLQRLSMVHHIKNNAPPPLGSSDSVFLYPVIGSWGFSPRRDNWVHFQNWFKTVCDNKTLSLYIPNNKLSMLYSGRKQPNTDVWTVWHMYHAYINSEYTLYTNIPGHVGLSTNWREKGLHFKSHRGKTNNLLQNWLDDFDNLPARPTMVNLSGEIIS
ncbi:uncharacterized protein LOC132751215 [Ruditapes philippinarum]|uniref:uncharacterized protein LOC132751215 n=1 Tax=Ruditapes philippinarum TaxID=129788 RepID=UPI00295B6976|nr:uncharacterized protein LOC132751215 [Ruditapes philippinarum]